MRDTAAPPRPSSRATATVAAGGLAGAALAFVVAFVGGFAENHGLAATGRGLAVLVPVAIGLYEWRHPPARRYAGLLVLLGFAMVPVSLAEAHTPALYSAGRVAAWIAAAATIVLFLAFPSGLLARRDDRALAGAMVLVLVLLYLPTALLADGFPDPAPATTCARECPANAFDVLGAEPAFVGDVMIPLREAATVLIMFAVAVTLAGRVRRATRLARRTFTPGVVVAAIHLLTLATFFWLRAQDGTSELLPALGWLVFLGPPLLALALAIAEVRRRQYVACALERLAVGLPSHATAASLRHGMATSLEDPTLRILYRLEDEPDGRWVDESGWPVAPPTADPGGLTAIHSDGRQVAAIVHDPWLAEDPALLAAAGSYALVVLENERLVTELRTSLADLAESRARVVAVADRERRRIERDLHDGAQQRLVGMRIQLELAAQRLRRVMPKESDALMELGISVEETIDEVRMIARGVFPALLADQGLEEALRSAARHVPMTTGVSATGVSRWSPEIETTVYFACVEALQNAIKHASGATGITIALEGRDGRLRFEVRDDGPGFRLNGDGGSHRGSGLVNMRDRVGAIGGELAIVSAPGRGTRIIGWVPTA